MNDKKQFFFKEAKATTSMVNRNLITFNEGFTKLRALNVGLSYGEPYTENCIMDYNTSVITHYINFFLSTSPSEKQLAKSFFNL